MKVEWFAHNSDHALSQARNNFLYDGSGSQATQYLRSNMVTQEDTF